MLVLGIESSCDETGAAVVRDGRYLLSNVVASQAALHDRYGGVVPEVASRQQLTTIIPVIETALEQSGVQWSDLDGIAATYGPGLAGSLLIGLTAGKTLALARHLPFIGINHLEAHIYANWLRKGINATGQGVPPVSSPAGGGPGSAGGSPAGAGAGSAGGSPAGAGDEQEGDPRFPVLSLIVSGAHSELVLIRRHGHYQLLGRTRDDASGEAFDKVARILGLGYPGGPAIQKAADQAEHAGKPLYKLPRPWLRGTYDFSFSGLKKVVLQLVQGSLNPTIPAPVGEPPALQSHPAPAGEPPALPGPTHTGKDAGGTSDAAPDVRGHLYTRMGAQAAEMGGISVPDLAAEFQEAVVDVLATKTRQAAEEHQVAQVLLAGGVAANNLLRTRLEQELRPLNIPLTYPPIEFCTDNAAMIAAAGYFHLRLGERHSLDLDVRPGLQLPFAS
jgi:N6-L-threonylcarbamoyladenine synthase